MTRAWPGRPQPKVFTALALLAAGVVVACSSSPASPASAPATGGDARAAVSLATSFATTAYSWAVVPVSSDPAFWEVFDRAANSRTWQLVTPPGVADNGGLVASANGEKSLTVAVRPTQDLVFSPLAATADGGRTWSTDGPINASVADSPGALSAFGAKLVALLGNGAIDASANAGASWSTMAAPGAVAASAAAKGCGGAVRVTTISFGPTGTDVLAGGTCGNEGTAAMFDYSPGSGWQRASLPASSQIVQLTDASALVLGKSGITALWPAAIAGSAQSVTSAWTASASLPVSGAIAASGSLAGPGLVSRSGTLVQSRAPEGAGAWVLLADGQAAAISPPASAAASVPRWQVLPRVPARTSVLASGPDGAVDALAVSATTLTVWRLATDSTTWSMVQALTVPLQYGSSS
jgi:hypothetical protein